MTFNFNEELNKIGLTEEQYQKCLMRIEEKMHGGDIDWNEIVDEFHLNVHPDTLRKASQTLFGGYAVSEYYKSKANNDISQSVLMHSENYYKDADAKLEKAKVLNSETNKWLRETNRDEMFMDEIVKAIKESYPPSDVRPKWSDMRIRAKHDTSGITGVLCIADIHFGKEFKIYGFDDEILNEYSPEICYERMNKLFEEVIAYVKDNQMTNIRVFNLGDALEGFIRQSQLAELRYGVVDSAIIFGKYLGEWLKKLSHHVAIDYYETSGNHGELRLLDGLKGQHLNENIEKVTEELIRQINIDNPNFKIHTNQSGLIYTNVQGYDILGIHGEVKNLGKAITEFEKVYKKNIDYIIGGHVHHKSLEETSTRGGAIGVGSIIGSDDYSFKLRRSADATAMFLTFKEGEGLINQHTFVLN